MLKPVALATTLLLFGYVAEAKPAKPPASAPASAPAHPNAVVVLDSGAVLTAPEQRKLAVTVAVALHGSPSGRVAISIKRSFDGLCTVRAVISRPPLLPKGRSSVPGACSFASIRARGVDLVAKLKTEDLTASVAAAEAAPAKKKEAKAPASKATQKLPTPRPTAPRRATADKQRGNVAPKRSHTSTPKPRKRAARLHLGLSFLQWRLSFSGANPAAPSQKSSALGVTLLVELYPIARFRQDHWADLGLYMGYARSFSLELTDFSQNPAEASLDRGEIGLLFRFHTGLAGGMTLKLGVGYSVLLIDSVSDEADPQKEPDRAAAAFADVTHHGLAFTPLWLSLPFYESERLGLSFELRAAYALMMESGGIERETRPGFGSAFVHGLQAMSMLEGRYRSVFVGLRLEYQFLSHDFDGSCVQSQGCRVADSAMEHLIAASLLLGTRF
jgi:hypothetical protein